MADEGVHEFQLNGKQLVFLFMSATLAAAVIFLCGVMVGRGVMAARPDVLAEVSPELAFDPTSNSQSQPLPAIDVTPSGASPSTSEDLTYARRLEASEPPPEPAVEPIPSPPAAAADEPAEPREAIEPPAPRATQGSDAAVAESQGEGYVVQVAAVRARAEAEDIARRLAAKGFPSFVTTPGSAAPGVYRVRVGKYSDRREAERVARRLQEEEQFKPWITR